MKEAVPGPISGREDRLGGGDSSGGAAGRTLYSEGQGGGGTEPAAQGAQEGCSPQRTDV